MRQSKAMSWPLWTTRAAASLVIAVGALVTLAWLMGYEGLTSIFAGWPKMASPTAISFTLLGLALLPFGFRLHTGPPWLMWLARGCSALAVLIGTLRLAGYLMGFELGIDRLGMLPSSGSHAPLPGRMSPATALSVALLGAALLCASRPRLGRQSQVLALVALLLGWLGTSRYFFGGEPLLVYANMALHTALLVLVLSAGVLCARADMGLVNLLSGEDAAGAAARRLVPAVVLVPLAVGWIGVGAQHAGWLGPESGMSLFALSSVVLLGAVVWSSAARMRRIDQARQRAAHDVVASQRLLQAIVDNTGAVIYVKDLAGRYVMVNRRYRDLFRLDNEAVIGKTDHDLLPSEVAEAVRAMDVRVALAQAPLTEEEIVPLDDEPRTYVSVKAPLRDAEGCVSGVFGISTDITDRKHAQARLQAQLERMNLLDRITCAIGERQDLQSIYQVVVRSLEEQLPADFCCVCHYDAGAHELTVIRVGVRSQALAMDLAMGESATVPIDENGLSRCVQGQLVYEAEIADMAFPFPQRLARGGLRSMVAAPLQSESRVFGVLVVARRQAHAFSSGDCEFLRQLSAHVALAARQAELHASLQRAYEDLRQTQQALVQQERLRALGQMASGIAHDINNAISPILLYTESLLEREPNLSERGRAQLETIARAIDDVAATVSRMREFYRQREEPLALVPLPLNQLIEQVVELTRARWHDMPQQRGIVIKLRIETAATVPHVMGVESDIREALINLIFNAVDAMPEGGDLILRTCAARDSAGAKRARLEVIDSGVGMDEQTRHRCLEPFFTTKGERGTGLGLAMVYGAVQRHAADIEIQSAPGQGTTIAISFPAVEHSLGDGSEGFSAAMAAPARPLRILLIDDDPLVLQSLRTMLESDGHEVIAADGGQAGIDAFNDLLQRGKSLGLVITDLGMPYVDGRRVASAIKQADSSTPVILLTGWGQRLVGDGDEPKDVDQVLSKPPKLAELRKAIALHGGGLWPASKC